MAERTDALLGTGDLARRFGWSTAGIAKLDRIGVLPTTRRIAGRRVWSEDQLDVIAERINARRRQGSGGIAA